MLTTNTVASPKPSTTTHTAKEDDLGQIPDDPVKLDDGKSESRGKEDDSQGFRGGESAEEHERQKEGETQLSEESTLTERQQSEQIINQEESQSDQEMNGNRDKEQQQQQDESQNSNADQSLNQKPEETQQVSEEQDEQEATKKSKKKKKSKGNDQQQQKIQHAVTEPQTGEVQTQEDSTFTDETRDPKKELTSVKESEGHKTAILPTHDEDFLQTHTNDQDSRNQNHQENQPEQQQQQQDSVKEEEKSTDSNSDESLDNSGIPKESTESKNSWATQAGQSINEKARRKDERGGQDIKNFTWQLCNETAGTDYIPCLDNEEAIRHLHGRKHFEHRERHCPAEGPTCLVPIPKSYKRSIKWPDSRNKV